MKKINLGIIIVIILVVIVMLSVGGDSTNTRAPLTIGADFVLSGNNAEYGEWARKGAELALEEINSSGGVNGQPVRIIFEDFAGDTAKAVTAYNKLRDIDKVSAVMTQLSSPALAVQKYVNQDKIIQMDISASATAYSTPDDYSFRVGVVATQLAGEAANTLYNTLNARKVAVLYINNDFGLGMKRTFSDVFKGQIVSEDSYPQGSTDFRTQLTKIKSSAGTIDYILLVGHNKEAGLLVKQAKELGIQTKIFSDTYSVEGPDFLKNAGTAAEGLIFVVTKFDPNSTDAAVKHFTDAYQAKYNSMPVAYAAQAYDAVKTLAKSFEKCENTDTACTKQELMKLDYEGVSGRIKFDINGDVVKNVGLKIIKDAKFVAFP